MMFWVLVIFIVNISDSFVESQEFEVCGLLIFDDKNEVLDSCGPDNWAILGKEFEGIDFDGDEYPLGAKGPGEFCSNFKIDVNCHGSADFSILYYYQTKTSLMWYIENPTTTSSFNVPLDTQNEWTLFNGGHFIEGEDLKMTFYAKLDESEIILIKYIMVRSFKTPSESTSLTTTTGITKTTTAEIQTEKTTTTSSCTDSPLIENDNGRTLWMILAIIWMSLFVVASIVIIFLRIKKRIHTSQPVFIKIKSTAPVYLDNSETHRPSNYPRWGNPLPVTPERVFTNVYHY